VNLLLVLLALAPSSLRAQAPATHPATQPADNTAVRKWLADLASPDASVRDGARAKMMTLTRDDLPALQKLVEEGRPLAPSQAIAIRQIVQEVYLAGEPYQADENKGFLGILMDNSGVAMRDFDHGDVHGDPGVVVAERIPGFCASRMLLDGDVILGTTNPRLVFTDSSALQQAIQAVLPGETIHLQVLRNGRVIDVPLILDPKPAEASIATITGFKLRRATKFQEFWEGTFAPLLREQVG
jgi:hypothetical protein